MTLSESDRRSINMSALNATRRGARITAKELNALRTLYPNYDAILKACPGRSYNWARRNIQTYKIAKERNIWSAKEITLLRKLYPDTSLSMKEVASYFPGRSKIQVGSRARSLGLRRDAPFVPVGIPALDAVRAEARRLNYSMPDLDKLVGDRKYFTHCKWRGKRRWINWRAICRAAEAMGGRIEIRFDD